MLRTAWFLGRQSSPSYTGDPHSSSEALGATVSWSMLWNGYPRGKPGTSRVSPRSTRSDDPFNKISHSVPTVPKEGKSTNSTRAIHTTFTVIRLSYLPKRKSPADTPMDSSCGHFSWYQRLWHQPDWLSLLTCPPLLGDAIKCPPLCTSALKPATPRTRM